MRHEQAAAERNSKDYVLASWLRVPWTSHVAKAEALPRLNCDVRSVHERKGAGEAAPLQRVPTDDAVVGKGPAEFPGSGRAGVQSNAGQPARLARFFGEGRRMANR